MGGLLSAHHRKCNPEPSSAAFTDILPFTRAFPVRLRVPAAVSCTGEKKRSLLHKQAAKASQREQRLGDAVRAEQLLAFTLLISGGSELTMQAAARLQRRSLTALSPGTKCLFHLTSEAVALLREPT